MNKEATRMKIYKRVEGIVARLSVTHPLYYLCIYFLLIPLFATVYGTITHGFYAPYARLEYNGRSDTYEAGQVLQQAFRRWVKERSAGGSAGNKWVWDDTMLYVQRFLGGDGTLITFDLYVMGRRTGAAQSGLFQMPIRVSWKPGASKIIELSSVDRVGTIYYYFDIGEDPLFKSGSDPRREGLYDQVLDDFRRIIITKEEDEQLMRFVSGLAGDATAVSGSYGRMLYLSAMVITTVGFGDIVPITGVSRSLVAAEAICGILLAGLFLNAVAYRASLRKTV